MIAKLLHGLMRGLGVQPYWTGESAKEDAISYAKARAKYGRGEIRVLNPDGSIEQTIPFTCEICKQTLWNLRSTSLIVDIWHDCHH